MTASEPCEDKPVAEGARMRVPVFPARRAPGFWPTMKMGMSLMAERPQTNYI